MILASKRKLALLTGLLFFFSILSGCGGGDPEQTTPKGQELSPEKIARVSYVIDGDTLVLEDGERIRFLGINAPEIRKKHAGRYEGEDEPWGRDAANFAGRLLEGKEIGLIFDQEKTGKYGRTLAYIIYDGDLFQEILLKEGYARYADYGQPLKYGEILRRAEAEGKSRRRGLWEKRPGRFQPPKYSYSGKHETQCYSPRDRDRVTEWERFRVRQEVADRFKLNQGTVPKSSSSSSEGFDEDARYR